MIGLPEVAKARKRGRLVGGLYALAACLGFVNVATVNLPMILSAAVVLASAIASHRAWLCLYHGERLLAEVERGIVERDANNI